MSFDLFHDDAVPPEGPGAHAVAAEARRRRLRQRSIVGGAASLALVLVAAVALRSPSDKQPVVADEPADQQALAPSTTFGEPTTSPFVEASATTTVPRTTTTRRPVTITAPPPSTTTTSWYGQTWISHPGTANLTYGGVLSGQLQNAVAKCTPRPGASSDIQVNGVLNGTEMVLLVQSYTGEMGGAYSVITGRAGGGTGMEGSGYRTAEVDYPATQPGVTNVDWAHGASLNVDLASQEGQSPSGTIHVSGTISCP